jgi:hypothetical protein
MSTTRPPRWKALARGVSTAVTTLALAVGAVVLSAGSAVAAPPECTAAQPGGPVQVTPDYVDPLDANPVIDSEQDLTSPVTASPGTSRARP